MLSQVKWNSEMLLTNNPESSCHFLSPYHTQDNKKKKSFQIKKSKLLMNKKNKKQEFFNDPLYQGLQNYENENENKQNFGPWIKENQANFYTQQQQKIKLEMIHDQNNNDSVQRQVQRQILHNEHYFHSERQSTINTNNQDNMVGGHNYLPSIIKPKRQLHKIKFSSLVLQTPKSVQLSPLKIAKNKQSTNALTRNKSQGLVVDLLRYESLKCLPSTQKLFDKKVQSRPNNVIYNYCCNYDPNIFLNQSIQMNEKRIQDSKNIYEVKNPVDRNIFDMKIISSSRNNLKERLQTKIDEFVKRQCISTQYNSKWSPYKKTISQQLYDDLIKKKNKFH